MLDKKNIIALIVIVQLIASCIAGDGTLKCYSRLVSDSSVVRKTLYAFWAKHPENRLDEATMQKIEKYHPNIFKVDAFIDSSTCYNCRSALRSYVRKGDFEREEWYIKSSNNEMVFNISISNVDAWINGFTCDVCLKSVLFLDAPEQNFKSWNQTKQRKKQARKTFETDVLPKLKKIAKQIKLAETKEY